MSTKKASTPSILSRILLILMILSLLAFGGAYLLWNDGIAPRGRDASGLPVTSGKEGRWNSLVHRAMDSLEEADRRDDEILKKTAVSLRTELAQLEGNVDGFIDDLPGVMGAPLLWSVVTGSKDEYVAGKWHRHFGEPMERSVSRALEGLRSELAANQNKALLLVSADLEPEERQIFERNFDHALRGFDHAGAANSSSAANMVLAGEVIAVLAGGYAGQHAATGVGAALGSLGGPIGAAAGVGAGMAVDLVVSELTRGVTKLVMRDKVRRALDRCVEGLLDGRDGRKGILVELLDDLRRLHEARLQATRHGLEQLRERKSVAAG